MILGRTQNHPHSKLAGDRHRAHPDHVPQPITAAPGPRLVLRHDLSLVSGLVEGWVARLDRRSRQFQHPRSRIHPPAPHHMPGEQRIVAAQQEAHFFAPRCRARRRFACRGAPLHARDPVPLPRKRIRRQVRPPRTACIQRKPVHCLARKPAPRKLMRRMRFRMRSRLRFRLRSRKLLPARQPRLRLPIPRRQIAHHPRRTALHRLPAHLERVRKTIQCNRTRTKLRTKVGHRLPKTALRPRRQHQNHRTAALVTFLRLRPLLQNHMRVRSTETKRTHSRTARISPRLPLLNPPHYIKRTPNKIDVGV